MSDAMKAVRGIAACEKCAKSADDHSGFLGGGAWRLAAGNVLSCAVCAALVEDAIRRDEAGKWLQAVERHSMKCDGIGGECPKMIANERLSMRLEENPKLPREQWWP